MEPNALNEKLQKLWPFAIVALVSLLGGAAIGWGLKPEVLKTEEKVKVVEVEKQVVVEKEKVRIEVVRVKDTAVVERYHKEKTTQPDGTVREVEDRNIDTVVHDTTAKTEVKVVEVEKQVVVEKEKRVEIYKTPVLPNWHVGVMGGTELLTPLPVFGLEGERRIAGPFWLGVYGNANTQFSRGQVGVKLAVEF